MHVHDAPPRPTETKEMILQAAIGVAAEINDLHCPADEAAKDIADVYRAHHDSYELMRELEQDKGWPGDRDTIDALDNMAFLVRDQIDKAQRDWIEAHDIQPHLPNGTVIKLHDSTSESDTGEIVGICNHKPAAFLVEPAHLKNNNPNQMRHIILFEKAEVAA